METVLKFFNGKIEGIFILTSRYEGSYLGGMMHRINEAFWYGSMLIEREEMTPGNVLTTFYALLIGTFIILLRIFFKSNWMVTTFEN
ncbi:uncharacterized protein [Oscarella lobularis]|uniref:uncharacterized protein isoform X3 n=1 Tax=Oscarella lobularis TaxID=121494 RepID=UPI0033132929